MISAKIIKDSINVHNSSRITTWELIYPRFIHAELMTHRMFSRNSASSRAIPIQTMIDTIRKEPATPVHWGKNQSGMQAKEELEGYPLAKAMSLWDDAVESACKFSEEMAAVGVHKQIANRVTEFAQHMKIVMTTTEHNNWFWLRNHEDAQPEIFELAKIMQHAYDCNQPVVMHNGQWHLPFVESTTGYDYQYFYDEKGDRISLDQARMISASCCAQVSYRKNDPSLEKAENIFKRLIESEPCHASPVEHQAMAFKVNFTDDWPEGVTHIDKEGNMWSGNFRGWIQFRQLIPNNAKKG